MNLKSLTIRGEKQFYYGQPLEAWSCNGGNYGGNSNLSSDPEKVTSVDKNISSLTECFEMLAKWKETEKNDKEYPYEGGYILDYKTRTAYYDEPGICRHILRRTGNYFKNFVRLNSWSFENGVPIDVTIKKINFFFLRAGYYECIVTTKDEISTKYDRKMTLNILPAKEWEQGTYVTYHGAGKIDDLSRYTDANHFYIETTEWESNARSMKSRSYTALPKQVADGQEYYTKSLYDNGICDYGASFFLKPKLKCDEIVFEKDDDGKYTAHFVDFPRRVGKGRTKAAAIGDLVLNSQHQMDLHVDMSLISQNVNETVLQ